MEYGRPTCMVCQMMIRIGEMEKAKSLGARESIRKRIVGGFRGITGL